jgi:hypothetical protein
MRTHKLLAEHESFVTSTADVKEHVDKIIVLIETLLCCRAGTTGCLSSNSSWMQMQRQACISTYSCRC